MRWYWPGLVALAVTTLLGACTSDDSPTATPAPAIESTVSSTPATPESTWTAPTPITSERGVPLNAPGAAHPTVGLRADGIPLAAAGTLVVYAKELRGKRDVEVVVFDLGTATRLSAFPLEAKDSLSVQLAANRVLASFGRQLLSYALDGSDGRLISDELSISYMRPSPDGRHVAVTGADEDRATGVALFEVESGVLVQHVDMLTALPEWRGEPHPVRWLSNHAVLIGGLCHCDTVQEGYFDASVSLDGSVTRLLEGVPPEHRVEVRIAENYDATCNLGGFNGGRSVQLVDTATGEVLAEARADSPVFAYVKLSPDAEEALVISIVADDELKRLLNGALDAGECVEWSEQSGVGAAPLQFGVLRAGETALEAANTRLEVLERWHDGLVPIIACGGEERAAADASNGLDPAPWRDPAGFGKPWGFRRTTAGRVVRCWRCGWGMWWSIRRPRGTGCWGSWTPTEG